MVTNGKVLPRHLTFDERINLPVALDNPTNPAIAITPSRKHAPASGKSLR